MRNKAFWLRYPLFGATQALIFISYIALLQKDTSFSILCILGKFVSSDWLLFSARPSITVCPYCKYGFGHQISNLWPTKSNMCQICYLFYFPWLKIFNNDSIYIWP